MVDDDGVFFYTHAVQGWYFPFMYTTFFLLFYIRKTKYALMLPLLSLADFPTVNVRFGQYYARRTKQTVKYILFLLWWLFWKAIMFGYVVWFSTQDEYIRKVRMPSQDIQYNFYYTRSLYYYTLYVSITTHTK